ncbi:MAG: ParA family protein [Endomicrobium sp.]|jgi:chromosome partitioning protein|nr:ParA family protein [Endomicrobium sp.]
MIKSITVIINQKGGVGKTTTACALGIGLSRIGYKVLFIDLDAQCNLSYNLNANLDSFSIFDLLNNKPLKVEKVIQHINNIDLIPNIPKMSVSNNNLVKLARKKYKLKNILKDIKDNYDYIIIDTPPSFNIFTINALVAADSVIIVALSDIFSIRGIYQVNDIVNGIQQRNNKTLKILGILLTKYNVHTILNREMTKLLYKTAKNINTKLYNTKIRESIHIKESQLFKQNIYNYMPNSNVTTDYKNFTKEYIKDINKKIIN